MMYILDTDVLSELSRQSGHGALKSWIREQYPRTLIVTVSTHFEIFRGIERLRGIDPDKSNRLEQWFIRLMEDQRFVTVNMTSSCAKIYAKMTLRPELRYLWTTPAGVKEPKCGQDLAIAATAIFHNVPIVTRNTKDFLTIHSYFRLPGLYNPVQQAWHVDIGVSDDTNAKIPQISF